MKRSTSGLLIILLFLLTSCGGTTKNNQSNNLPSVEQETLEKRDTPSELIELDESYNYYISRINNGLLEFRDLVYNLDYSTLIIDNRSVWGISTEGAQLTRFMTSEGNVLRYTFNIFGESGRTTQNYYSFDDELIYVQDLYMGYADGVFSINTRFDILNYNLTSYVIDDTKIFLIDTTFNRVTEVDEVDEVKYYSPNELNDFFNEGTQETDIPRQKTLSEMVYPEWIWLSENYWSNYGIFSPIDHDYNIIRLEADFIDSFAGEFAMIWWEEMEYQYNQCLNNMPERFVKQFTEQQSAWEKYYSNDVFPEIAMNKDYEDGIMVMGYGYEREAVLIRLDKIRARTIDIMRVQSNMDGFDKIEFSYQSVENE